MTEEIQKDPMGEEVISAPTPPANKKKIGYSIIAGFSVAVVLGIIIWYLTAVQSVKALSESSFAVSSSQIFRIPIASIDSSKILYSDYIDNLHAMRKFFDTDTQAQQRPSDLEMSDYVLSRLLVNELIEKVAGEFNVSLTEDEIKQIVEQNLITSFESREKGEEELMNRYGWTLDEFVQKIVVPTELERKLTDTYLKSLDTTATNEAIHAQAEEVLARVKKGESFETLAKEFGSDGTAETGGELEWFSKGDMVKEFEDAAFALKKGQLNDTLVETQYGYHILRVDDRKMVDDPSTPGQKIEQIKARHILFEFPSANAAAFGDFMNTRLKLAQIKVSKGVHNPFEDLFKETIDSNSTSTSEEVMQ